LIFLILAKQMLRVGRPWLLFAGSVLLFSVLQYENWSFGFTLIGFLGLAAAIGGLALLAQPGFSWLRFIGALLAGTVAMFSYSNNILYWVVGPLLLWAGWREERRLRLAPWLIWIGWAALALLLYYHGYHKPGGMPPLKFFIQRPDVFLGYFITLLGGAVANTPGISLWIPAAIGAAGCLLFGIAGLIAIFRPAPAFRPLAFWLALGSYAALGALAITVGRCAHGIPHALESRYTTLTSLFWIATLVLTVSAVKPAELTPARQPWRRILNTLLAVFAAGCAVLFVLSSASSLRLWQAKANDLLAVRDELLCDIPDQSLLARSYPDPALLKPRIEFLTRHGLSLFREKKAFAEYKIVPIATPRQSIIGHAPFVFPPKALMIYGQIIDSNTHDAVQAVVMVTTNSDIVARARVKFAKDLRQSNWESKLSAAIFPAGPIRLNIFALLRDRNCTAPIGELELESSPLDFTNAPPGMFFTDPAPAMAGCVDQMGVAGDQVYGSGWARNPADGRPGQWVIVTDQANNVLAYTEVAEIRDDVARQLRNPTMLKSGWRLAFHKSRLPPGPSRLTAWLYLPEKNQALRLRNDFEVSN
jgi:hypothetical protein